MNRPPIIRPETCGHYFLYSRTRCVWCGTWEQEAKNAHASGVLDVGAEEAGR